MIDIEREVITIQQYVQGLRVALIVALMADGVAPLTEWVEEIERSSMYQQWCDDDLDLSDHICWLLDGKGVLQSESIVN